MTNLISKLRVKHINLQFLGIEIIKAYGLDSIFLIVPKGDIDINDVVFTGWLIDTPGYEASIRFSIGWSNTIVHNVTVRGPNYKTRRRLRLEIIKKMEKHLNA